MFEFDKSSLEKTVIVYKSCRNLIWALVEYIKAKTQLRYKRVAKRIVLKSLLIEVKKKHD